MYNVHDIRNRLKCQFQTLFTYLCQYKSGSSNFISKYLFRLSSKRPKTTPSSANYVAISTSSRGPPKLMRAAATSTRRRAGMEIYMSCSHCQELGQQAAQEWTTEQPIRSIVSKLTQLLTMTTTHKFPPQAHKPYGGGPRLHPRLLANTNPDHDWRFKT